MERGPGVSSSLLGPVVPSFRALSGRLDFTVRRHKFNKDSLPRKDLVGREAEPRARDDQRVVEREGPTERLQQS